MLGTIAETDKKCGWCMTDKDVFHVELADKSFQGPVCLRDLSRMLKCRHGKKTDVVKGNLPPAPKNPPSPP